MEGRVVIISGTERNGGTERLRLVPDLQEYDNLRNGTAGRTVIGRNGNMSPMPNLTLTLTLCLTLTITYLTLTLP